ncbi:MULTISPECIES: rhombosortase [Vibrio]|uniref:Rhombosortase n=1 Tax=Vibrio natriegens NBRC 15636 = ATCC 14048 = DSM 759 TaxID=1219067 RepID=A0AAN1CV09_VIBNA|nr:MULTISPECIES: rhombosortase [Vibrio]MEE3880097.1 rhombosortase [Vibrio sp. YYF0003]ALR16101.1 membrane protein [Vibrio natriegens NBRC 15636 = ATCC 14048 = DSM 759]ANQ12037.1 rhombosortase [Vibrio natriegens NBRC 15636 = ATCC 14048 = DSM 759]ANQ16520.1 rhombosortase [Vibrio natriegens]ANQ25857.1 rhombosortase [Vibrio natriegens]
MNLYTLLTIISVICVALQFEPMASLSEWHAYNIRHGEWWRIVTGNLTHTNFAHLGMNLAGLWIISFVFRPSTKNFLIVFLLLCTFVGALNLFTNMKVYVGLSGVLHGLFGFWALREVFEARRSSLLLVGGLIAKVVWEQLYGPSTSTAAMIGARVAIDAHLFGTIGGLGMALLEKGSRRRLFG